MRHMDREAHPVEHFHSCDADFRAPAGHAHFVLAKLDLAEGHFATARDRFAAVALDNPAAPYANDALEKLQVEPWDVVLLDIKMPGLQGLELLKQVNTSHGVTVLMVTHSDEAEGAGEQQQSRGRCRNSTGRSL